MLQTQDEPRRSLPQSPKERKVRFKLHPLLLPLLALALTGCSNSQVNTSPDLFSPPDLASPDLSMPPLLGRCKSSITEYQAELPDMGGFPPLPGAKICVLGHPDVPCQQSSIVGGYTIQVPLTGWTQMLVTAAGHLSSTLPMFGEPKWNGWEVACYVVIPLKPDALASLLAAKLGAIYPAPGKAFVQLYVVESTPGHYSGLANATVTISPAAGKGPVYVADSGEPDPLLQATTSHGGVYFAEVNPGPFELTVTVPGKLCGMDPSDWGTSGTRPNTLDGEAVAGALTEGLKIYCH